MGGLEKFIRFAALPLCVFAVIFALGTIWIKHPGDEDFLLGKVLPVYSLYLVLTAVCWKIASNAVQQFLLITLILATLFAGEMLLRIYLGINFF